METWQIGLIVAVACAALLLIGLVSREVFYAANPDKRPLKKKRRRSS